MLAPFNHAEDRMSVDYPEAGAHPDPDELLSARKRREAALASGEGRSARPQERHAPEAETVTAKPAKRATKKKA